MELTTLRQVRAIAQHGHVTRAAHALGISQPALSAMLKKLEADLGLELFHRTGRGVELTEAGRVFLRHAEDALRASEQARRAVRALAGLEGGSIALGGGATAITCLLPPVISAFRRAHPGLRFSVREAGSRAVAQGVLSGELDLGIVTLPLEGPGTADLLVRPWAEDALKLIVPPGHRLSGARSFRWKDIAAGEPMIAFEAGSAVRMVIDRALAEHGVSPDVVMELRSIEGIKRMVEAGVGMALVSRFALGPGEGLDCREGGVSRSLAIVRRRDRVPSPAAAAFEKLLIGSAPGGPAGGRAARAARGPSR
ncbi:MAG: LysR family transcriptional regulator [Phycisphaerales bacterium]|nr:LysR family transcriptional regulator [Phycisphaerales bacterium]